MNVAIQTYGWFLARTWMWSLTTCREIGRLIRLVTHINESWHTHECCNSNIWMIPGTHMNVISYHFTWNRAVDTSCHTYQWVMAHTWMWRITCVDESWHTYECGVSHIKAFFASPSTSNKIRFSHFFQKSINIFYIRILHLRGIYKWTSQVIFRKRAINYKALLRKWHIKIRHPMIRRHPVSRSSVHSLISKSHVTHMNESWHEHGVSNVWMSHGTHMSVACHAERSWVFTSSLLRMSHAFLDGYCSTVQDLLDWFEVDLGFTKLYLFR